MWQTRFMRIMSMQTDYISTFLPIKKANADSSHGRFLANDE
jgi:hypothetical protein